MKTRIIDEIFWRFETYGGQSYGENVTVLAHSLQTAHFASLNREPESIVVAALLHDVGHLLHGLPEDIAEQGVDGRHEEVGAQRLSAFFPPIITEPIRLHVPAKRYLCATEPAYMKSLSEASRRSLSLQGGPFSDQEVREFEEHPFCEEAITLRRYDDLGKDPELEVEGLPQYRPLLEKFVVGEAHDSDKLLFTPGPLTTSDAVKRAMQRDLGSRDGEFIRIVSEIRGDLLALGGVAAPEYEAVLMQGSGTFGIESVIASVTPPGGHWLMIVNGAYGKRMAQIAGAHKIRTTALYFPENETPEASQVEELLQSNSDITHVGMVHCETSTGIINPVCEIGQLASAHGKQFVVDAMSSFGALPLELPASQIDFLISSANKCIEGVPGFSFVLARRAALLEAKGYTRTLSLDLLAQWQGLEGNGQFRYTPPTHALLAFRQALRELAAEGGVAGRADRYRQNREILVHGMRGMGFHEYLAPENQGYIITSFRYPEHPNFEFDRFYALLNGKGMVIYPGKVSDAACFRIGNIGRIYPNDMRALLAAIEETLAEMEITLS